MRAECSGGGDHRLAGAFTTDTGLHEQDVPAGQSPAHGRPVAERPVLRPDLQRPAERVALGRQCDHQDDG